MKSLRRFATSLALVTATVCLLGISARALAQNELPNLPPSSLWSSELKKYYLDLSATPTSDQTPLPAQDASKAEWDRYYAWEQRLFAGHLARLEERYPVQIEDTKIGGVHVGVVSPRSGIAPEQQRRVLINLHAGGFVFTPGLLFGQIESIPVASLGRIKVITIDYRQAPSHRYPAASEDVEAVYRALLKQYGPASIGIYGCSAGGALTAQAVAWFQARGLPRPGAVGIFCTGLSPQWTRRTGDSGMWIPDIEKLAKDERARWHAVRWYMEKTDPRDPQAWPDSSDAVLAKFPPTLILIGTRDPYMSQAITAHARLLKLGVDSSLYVIEGGTHAVHTLAVGTPEAYDANAYIARWFDEHLAR